MRLPHHRMDGEYLVPASYNETVNNWRIKTVIGSPLNSAYMVLVSFSPDGFHFTSRFFYGFVRTRKLEGGLVVTCSHRGNGPICFSPDGKHIASGTLQILDSTNGELALNSFQGHSGFINSVYYSQDRNRISIEQATKPSSFVML